MLIVTEIVKVKVAHFIGEAASKIMCVVTNGVNINTVYTNKYNTFMGLLSIQARHCHRTYTGVGVREVE